MVDAGTITFKFKVRKIHIGAVLLYPITWLNVLFHTVVKIGSGRWLVFICRHNGGIFFGAASDTMFQFNFLLTTFQSMT